MVVTVERLWLSSSTDAPSIRVALSGARQKIQGTHPERNGAIQERGAGEGL